MQRSVSFRKKKSYNFRNAQELSHPRFRKHKTMLLHEPASTFDYAHFWLSEPLQNRCTAKACNISYRSYNITELSSNSTNSATCICATMPTINHVRQTPYRILAISISIDDVRYRSIFNRDLNPKCGTIRNYNL